MGAMLWLLAGLLVLALLWVVGTYNRLVRRRNEIANSFAHIDVQLKRRYDLIPNLVEVTRKYVQHERDTLEAVIAARNTARAAADSARGRPADLSRIEALAGAEQALGGQLSRLLAVVEAYPELKADASLRELREELTHTENRIGFARQAFNDSVLDYNNAVQQVPANAVAGLFRFRDAAPLEATTSAVEREPVKVAL